MLFSSNNIMFFFLLSLVIDRQEMLSVAVMLLLSMSRAIQRSEVMYLICTESMYQATNQST